MSSPGAAISALLFYATTPLMPHAVTSADINDVYRPFYKMAYQHSEQIIPYRQQTDELLDEICALTENWDGYGGRPIHEDTAANSKLALKFFLNSGITPELTPNSNGTISFEWTSDLGEAHIEFGRTRFVGNVRPKGSQIIGFSGETADSEAFFTALRNIVATVEAALFPRATEPAIYNSFTPAYAA